MSTATPAFSPAERIRIIEDILSWKCEEVEVGNGDEFTGEALNEWTEMLSDQTDAQLKDWWMGSVGEWVASWHDIQPTDAELAERGLDFDDWLTEVFEMVVAGEEIPHGYVTAISLTDERADADLDPSTR